MSLHNFNIIHRVVIGLKRQATLFIKPSSQIQHSTPFTAKRKRGFFRLFNWTTALGATDHLGVSFEVDELSDDDFSDFFSDFFSPEALSPLVFSPPAAFFSSAARFL